MPSSAVSGDLFEAMFSIWKLLMRNSSHRKADAEIATLVRLNRKAHFFLGNPQFRRERSTTMISGKKCCFQNIFLPKSVLDHPDISGGIKKKLEQLRLNVEYAARIIETTEGTLFQYTDDDLVYLNGVSMLRVQDIQLLRKEKCLNCNKANAPNGCEHRFCKSCCCMVRCKLDTPGKSGKLVCAMHRKNLKNDHEKIATAVPATIEATVSNSTVQDLSSCTYSTEMSAVSPESPTSGNVNPTNPVNTPNQPPCNCSSACVYRKCPCRLANVPCSTSCHVTNNRCRKNLENNQDVRRKTRA